jgi:hypothetical protein
MPEEQFDEGEAMFLSLVYSFHAAGMVQLGKVINPVSGKAERDLDAARGTVAVLKMLEAKTAGNLTDRERRTLANLVTELQLNYVDEANRAGPGEPAPAEAETPPADAPKE